MAKYDIKPVFDFEKILSKSMQLLTRKYEVEHKNSNYYFVSFETMCEKGSVLVDTRTNCVDKKYIRDEFFAKCKLELSIRNYALKNFNTKSKRMALKQLLNKRFPDYEITFKNIWICLRTKSATTLNIHYLGGKIHDFIASINKGIAFMEKEFADPERLALIKKIQTLQDNNSSDRIIIKNAFNLNSKQIAKLPIDQLRFIHNALMKKLNEKDINIYDKQNHYAELARTFSFAIKHKQIKYVDTAIYTQLFG